MRDRKPHPNAHLDKAGEITPAGHRQTYVRATEGKLEKDARKGGADAS